MVTRVNVRINGGLGSTSERWSVGLNYGTNVSSPIDSEVAQSLAQAIADGMEGSSTVFGALANGVGSGVTVTDIDVYGYGPTGGAVAAGNGVLTPARAFTGVMTAPPQTTGCVSLLTGLPGPSRRGRIYWPQLAPTLGTDFKSTTCKGLGAGLVALNTYITGILSSAGSWQLGVYSPKLDVVTDVTAVRSGDILDTQRRRRDALTEAYTLTPL